MKFHIILPYSNADTQYKIWANEEEEINFRTDFDRADRCTVCFAAVELEKYLNKLGFGVSVSERAAEGFRIVLSISEAGTSGEEFSFRHIPSGLAIEGTGRVGVLYGVYELLKTQGICWLNPQEEVLPAKTGELILPEERHYSASFPMGRGFTQEGALKESKDYWLWMARNRLNLSSYHARTEKFQKKLGMLFQQGGHIFENLIDPDHLLPSGKSIWEEHPEWYGLPESGVRTKEEAIYNQFCLTNESLLEFLSESILRRLQREWYHSDIVHVSGFDTWGKNCGCETCKSFGNGSDLNLHFLSFLRSYLDKARAEGRLDRDVSLCFSAYEGTANLKPPTRKVPENVRNSKDYILYCPIVRCYEHCIDDPACDYNRYYYKHLSGWKDVSMGINEYYNVSKFEDLPLLFTKTMANDLRCYHRLGVKCIQYMHHPIILWGVRNLTQLMYAELCWNVDLDEGQFLDNYFKARYGVHGERMRKAYALIEEAGKNCSSWRAWCQHSILSNLQNWDGGKPQKPLYRDSHLGSNAVAIGLQAVKDYQSAIAILDEELMVAEDNYIANTKFVSGVPVNPTDSRFKSVPNIYGERIKEDLMAVLYGADCMELLIRFVQYYEALEADADTKDIFDRITELVRKMSMYYMPIKYKNFEPEITCPDALTRCQLKDLYYRCKAKR